MQSELKMCPFCSEQCATLVIDQGDKWAHYEPSCLEVRTGYDLSDDAAWRAEAIAAWNARASDAEITRLTEALCFIGKWVERGVFDKQISARESLEVIINLPGMPWNSDRWDVDHKPYAAAYYARFPAALKGPSHDA